MTETTQSKTIVIIIVTAIAFAISFNLLIDHRVSALSFGDVSTFFERLMGRDRAPTNNKTTQPTTSKSDKTPQTNTKPTESSDNSATAGYKGEPLALVSPIDTSGLVVRYVEPSSGSASTASGGLAMGIPGESEGAVLPLRSSHQGWEIFGTPWYLWLLGPGIIALSTIYIVRSRKSSYKHAFTS